MPYRVEAMGGSRIDETVRTLAQTVDSATLTRSRYMCTCIILGNLLNIAYGINPGFSVLDECDVEIPDDDELWDATTSSQWESHT
jgi:hypothetical protein